MLLVLTVFVLVLSGMASTGWNGPRKGASLAPPNSPSPGGSPAGALAQMAAGAPAGYGLTNASALQQRAAILITSNAGLTTANGVRSGSGTAADPYRIGDWLIDASRFPNLDSMISIRNTTKYVVIENNLIINLNASNNWEGIQVGLYPYICITQNVVIRHNEVRSRTAYGISLREGTSYTRIESNLVRLNAARNWTYGIMTDRNVRNITISGNFVNAYTSLPLLTVGIQVGDFQVTPDRPATGILSEKNTVVNATSQGMTSDDTRNYTVRYNLIYSNYPGYKKIPSWVVRGIIIEEISNGTQVYGNEIFATENGIEVASGYGLYFSNTIHDSLYAVYINDNNAFKEARNTVSDTVYDTTYWNVTTPIRVPLSGNHTVLDVGPGVTTSNYSSVFLLSNTVPKQIRYDWSGTAFNLSMALGTRQVFDRQVSSDSQTLRATWTGSTLKLQVSRFGPTDIVFNLQSSTSATFAATSLRPAAYYDLLQSGQSIATAATDTSGSVSFGLPAPVSATYEVRFQSLIPHPTVTITTPANNTYVTLPLLRVAWTATDPGPGLQSVVLTLDASAPIDVTSLAAYTVTGLTDGRHVVRVTATDTTGLSASQSVMVVVDTQPPSVAIVSPVNNATVNSSAVQVAWNATDAVSGISAVQINLDNGPAIGTTAGNYSLVGLAQGPHSVAVTAIDNAGFIATATVSFVVRLAPGSGTNSSAGSDGAAVMAVTYLAASSTVDIAFTQPMNQTSVEQSLAISPDVNYSVNWVNASHVQIVLHTSLASGSVYQVVLQPSAKTASGVGLQHPFLFQFLAQGAGSATTLTLTWLPIMIVVVASLLIINWVTAGYLVVHYRKNAKRVKSTLSRFRSRYAGSLVIVYKKLATGVGRVQNIRQETGSKASRTGVVPRKPVAKVRKVVRKTAGYPIAPRKNRPPPF